MLLNIDRARLRRLPSDESLQILFMFAAQTGVVKTGGFRYDDGTRYIGDWNQKGQKHGMGHILLPDGTRYGW